MKDYSLIEKLKTLMNIIASSPLFLFCSMLGVAILILYMITIKKEKKVNKWIFIFIWIVLAIVIFSNYSSVVITLADNLFDDLFDALYFPDLTIYIIILLISNISFFNSLFNSRMERRDRIVNFTETLLVDILLILIIDIVKNNNINVYEKLTVYSNSNLLVLLELTSAVFTSWILVKLLISAHKKFKKYDNKDEEKPPEIVFE